VDLTNAVHSTVLYCTVFRMLWPKRFLIIHTLRTISLDTVLQKERFVRELLGPGTVGTGTVCITVLVLPAIQYCMSGVTYSIRATFSNPPSNQLHVATGYAEPLEVNRVVRSDHPRWLLIFCRGTSSPPACCWWWLRRRRPIRPPPRSVGSSVEVPLFVSQRWTLRRGRTVRSLR